MRKLMLLMAMLAVVLIAAAPAIAQTVGQKLKESSIRSGPATPVFSFSNKGDNVNACPSDQQVANTGNVANEQGAVQYNDTTEDISFAGSSNTITPAESSECSQTIGQAAAAK